MSDDEGSYYIQIFDLSEEDYKRYIKRIYDLDYGSLVVQKDGVELTDSDVKKDARIK